MRLAALQALQAASFSVVAFESCRGDYIATLREVADDPDPELRQRVLGILAREKDGFAQKKLLEGLENPEKALVPPEKALQLLSYDVHAEAYPVARDDRQQSRRTPRRSGRPCGCSPRMPRSAPVFEKILRDKDETPEIRQISAVRAARLEAGQAAGARARDRARRVGAGRDPGDEPDRASRSSATGEGRRRRRAAEARRRA